MGLNEREDVMTPEDLLFSKEHEWLRIVDNIGTIGISDHAQKELGEIVYVEMPKVGTKFYNGETFGNVESVKAVSELFMPASGEVVEINEELGAAPEKINEDPYGEGWMIRVRLTNTEDTADLMSAEEYDDYIKEEE